MRRRSARAMARLGTVLPVLAAALACAQPAAAQSSPVLAREQIRIVGLRLEAAPVYQAVPKNIATGVTTLLAGPPGSALDLPPLPADAVLLGELSGPAFSQPVTLVARPNEPLPVPPLALTGIYTVDKIRIVAGDEVLLFAEPAAVTIEVFDKILISQVSSRALSANEIRERGIVVDQENFQVIAFTAAFGIEGRRITIDFPMLIPLAAGPSAPVALPALSLPSLMAPAAIPEQRLPQLELAFKTPNVSVAGLLLKVEDPAEDMRGFVVPPLEGLIVIPGNVAFLNQFFSVLVMTTNGAPSASSLVVRDVTAKIVLPGGVDTVLGTLDDPLRMAQLGSPPAPQPIEQPICQRGPDEELGTSDDVCALAPTQSGESEFLVEGRREGTHVVEIEISGMLYGLPIGRPVRVSGRALGVVEVRNPTFALTLSHPATVTHGEQYDLLVTVTNTSENLANFVSVNLLPRSISGARLLSEESQSVETIAAGESATVAFQLLSQQTGNVVASSFTADDLPGHFELRTAVGAFGIPLSPNSLVLPAATNSLPRALRDAAVGFLGQAFSLATAPVIPRGLDPLGRAIVTTRATELAQAGQRVGFGEPLAAAVRDLLLDFVGNGFARIDAGSGSAAERAVAKRDFRGFDTLLRRSIRGADLLDQIAEALAPELAALGTRDFAREWAEAGASRPPQLMALASANGVAPQLRMVDPHGAALGAASAAGDGASEIAFGAWLALESATQLALATTPEPGAWQVELEGSGIAVDLALLVPDIAGPRLLFWQGVVLPAGARAHVAFTLGVAGDPTLAIDTDANGVPDLLLAPTQDELIADPGPSLISAQQVASLGVGGSDLARFGQVIALVFSEEISQESSQSGLTSELLTHYEVATNRVVASALQPGGRVMLLALRDPLGPFVTRFVSVAGLEDRLGHPQDPASQTLPIVPAELGDGGSVSGSVRRADGLPVRRAQVRLGFTGGDGVEATISVKSAGDDGRYGFDFVPAGGVLHFEAVDPDTGERGDARTQIRFDGQRLDLDLILLGSGTVAGRALAPNGEPLAGATVVLTSLTRFGERVGAITDSAGGFVLSGVPVGSFTLEAVHPATASRVVQASVLPAAGQTLVEDLVLLPIADPGNPIGTLRGQVFRSDGQTPAVGVPVYTSRGGYMQTDETGSYRIEGLPSGSIEVRALDQALLESGTAATEVVANTVRTANVLLFGGLGSVRGVVLDPDGAPVANALVGGGLRLVRTDTSGAFLMADVPVGSRTLVALDEASGLSGRASANLAGPGDEAVIQIVLEGRATLTGFVLEADGSTPVAGLTVYALGGRNLAAVTNQAGVYSFENLPLGPYLVSAFRPDFSDGEVASTKLVFHRETRRADVIFRGTGSVRVHVLNENGNPLGGAVVGLSELEVSPGLLRPPENTNCFDDVEIGDVTLDLPQCSSLGIGFRLRRLSRIETTPPDSGDLSFSGVFVGGFTIEIGNRFTGEVITASGTLPAWGETVDVTLQFESNAREVTGTVFGPDGVTPTGAGVLVVLRGSGAPLEARTDFDGRFLFQFPFVSGAFTLTAEDPASGLSGRTSASVERGATADVSVRLLGRGDVTIDVVGAAGAVAGAEVVLQRGTFPSDRRSGVTDAAGRVVFGGGLAVSEGPFGVSVFVPGSGARAFGSGVVPESGVATAIVVEVPDAAGSVAGRFMRVTGTSGIPNAQIRISTARGDNFATTDADGSFAFDGVAVGGFTLEAFDPATARRGRATGAIVAHQQQTSVDIVEEAQGIVVGVVLLSKQREPVPGADVTLSVTSPFGSSMRTTSAVDGGFRFPGVSAGSFTVAARDAAGHTGSVTGEILSEGQGVALEVVLAVLPVGRIEGVVTRANGDPATSVQVRLDESRVTSVDGDGAYAFDDVPVGAHALRASEQGGPDVARGSAEVAFDGDVARADLRFIGTGAVRGTVRDAVGDPVASAQVVLAARSTADTFLSDTTLTGANGAFEFARVPVGGVSVTATEAGTLLSGTGSGELVADGDLLELAIELEPAGAFGARVLREGSLTPAAGMAVELVGGAFRRYAATNTTGTFSFPDLAIRSWELVVTDPLGGGRLRFVISDLEAGETRDLGDLVLDESPPAVLAISPFDAAASVSPGTNIDVLFSEPVDPATVGPATLVVATAAGVVPGAWTLSSDGASASFLPSVPFSDFERVNLRVTTGVRDRVGRSLAHEVLSSFTTADATPPVVTSRSPAPGAVNVAVASVVRVAFSERLDPAGFGGAAIGLTRDGAPIAGQVQLILGDTVAVFLPAAPLAPNAHYAVDLRPARDVFGNQTIGESWAFDTLDTQAPGIAALTAAGGSSLFEGQMALVSADIGAVGDVAFIQFFVNGALVASDATAPFEFTLPIMAALGPNVVVTARATDRAGNQGPVASVSLSVTPSLPSVSIDAPVSGSSINSGAILTVDVSASDAAGVSQIVLQASGAVAVSQSRVLSAGTTTSSVRFTLEVPAGATPGSALLLRAVAVNAAGYSAEATPVTVTVTDASRPVVEIVSPAAGVQLTPGSSLQVVVRGTDNAGLASLTLRASGAASFNQSVAISPVASPAEAAFDIPIPSTATGAQTLVLTAEALDASGLAAIVVTRVLPVRDTLLPSVSLEILGGVSDIPAGGSVSVRVTASDEVGVTQLGLEVDGALLASVAVVPPRSPATNDFEVVVPETAAEGSQFAITGTAQDAAGNLGRSATQSLTVRSDVTPPIVTIADLPADTVLPVAHSDVAIVIDATAAAAADFGADVDGDGTSDSVLEAEVAAARRLLSLLDPTTSQVAVVSYASTAELRSGLISAFDSTENVLDAILAAGPAGSATLEAGLREATDVLVLSGRRDALPLVFVFAGGVGALPGSELTRASEGGIVVNAFAVGAGASPAMLAQLAVATGGEFRVAASADSLESAFSGAVLAGTTQLALVAEVVDDGSVSNVEFLVRSLDGAFERIVIDAEAPFAQVVALPQDNLPLVLVVSATARDAGGNEGASVPVPVMLVPGDTTPVIVRLVPSSAFTGDSIEIVGRFFSSDVSENLVEFAGASAPPSAASKIRLRVAVPPGATSGALRVSTVRLQSNEIDFTQLVGDRFDAAADFSSSANPNGPWGLGAAATLGAFSAYASHDQPSVLERWHLAPGVPESLGAPGTLWNGSGADVFVPYRWPAGTLGSHPGPNGEFGIVRFTAPELATIRIDAAFEGGDVATTDVHVLHNEAELFAGVVSGQGDLETFSRARRVATGDTIDFAVGANGSFFSDMTFVDAAILVVVPGGPDLDADGLSNDEEALIGTSPSDPDSDDDGLPDGEEFSTRGTDPLRVDTDGDLLGDGEEVRTHGTDPLRTDTDGDSLGDRFELLNGLNPLATDSDGDGLADNLELARGLAPTQADTDSDGLCDGGVTLASICPLGGEDLDGDGVLDPGETNPGAIDSDGDGYTDGHERADGSDPRDAASVPVGGKVWTGTVDTLWHIAGNWSPAGAPVAQSSVTIPGSAARQPLILGIVPVGRITLLPGAHIEIASDSSLYASGDVTVAEGADISGGQVALVSGSVGVRGLLPTLGVAGAQVRITGPTTVRGSLFTQGGPSSLDLNGQSVTVTGNLIIGGNDSFRMQNASDVLDVAGSATFAALNTGGLLTAGTLRVGRDFFVNTPGFFAAYGSHTVVFTGRSSQQILRFRSSSFANVRVEAGQLVASTNVTINGLFTVLPGSTVFGIPNEAVVCNGGIVASGAVFAQLPLVVRSVPVVLDDVTFRFTPPNGSALGIQVPALDAVLSNLSFETVPTTGSYISAFDTDGPATLARLRVEGSSPLHGLPKTNLENGFVIEWGSPADDTDGDGITDAFELANGLDPRDGEDAARDDDNDDLTNAQEVAAGTDRFDSDSDDDGFLDGFEFADGSDPNDATSLPPADKYWLGGDAADAASWSNPANWSPPGVPTATTSVVLPATAAFTPIVAQAAEVGDLKIGIGASLSLDGGPLRASGDVLGGGSIGGDGTLELAGSAARVQGSLPSLVRVTGQVRISDAGFSSCAAELCVEGNMIVTGPGADLDVAATGVLIAGDFSVESGATLTMREPGVLSVGGTFSIAGASTEGRLTDGRIVIQSGGFLADGDPQSFAPSGTHVVQLGNFSEAVVVRFSDPGHDRQRFHRFEMNGLGISLESDMFVSGEFVACGDCNETYYGNGHTLTTAIASASDVRFDQIALVVENGAESSFQGATFENADPTATQLTIQNASSDTQLYVLDFKTRPTTGLYLAIEGAGEVSVLYSRPLHGTPKTSVSPGVTLLWGDPADDTDGDGLSDADELADVCSDPLIIDTDLDGIPDAQDAEICSPIP